MTLAIIIAVLIMLLFQCFFEVAYVNGKSMEPTFQNGDALLLKKWGVPKKDDIIIAYIEELITRILDLHQPGKRSGKKLKNRNGKFKKHAAAGWKSD